MNTVRVIAGAHLLAWSQTFQVLAGAILPGARPKNRAAKVVRLIAQSARTRIVSLSASWRRARSSKESTP